MFTAMYGCLSVKCVLPSSWPMNCGCKCPARPKNWRCNKHLSDLHIIGPCSALTQNMWVNGTRTWASAASARRFPCVCLWFNTGTEDHTSIDRISSDLVEYMINYFFLILEKTIFGNMHCLLLIKNKICCFIHRDWGPLLNTVYTVRILEILKVLFKYCGVQVSNTLGI